MLSLRVCLLLLLVGSQSGCTLLLMQAEPEPFLQVTSVRASAPDANGCIELAVTYEDGTEEVGTWGPYEPPRQAYLYDRAYHRAGRQNRLVQWLYRRRLSGRPRALVKDVPVVGQDPCEDGLWHVRGPDLEGWKRPTDDLVLIEDGRVTARRQLYRRKPATYFMDFAFCFDVLTLPVSLPAALLSAVVYEVVTRLWGERSEETDG